MKLAQRLLNDFWSSAGKITSHFVHKRPTLRGTYRALPCPADITIETGQGGGRRFFVWQKVPRQIIYNQHSHFDVYGCGSTGTLPKMY